jgi:hypothetical protein
VLTLATSICFLDGYIKCQARDDLVDLQRSDAYSFFENCVELDSVLRIQLILYPIIVWSLYYSLSEKKTEATFNGIVEVLSLDDKKRVTRVQAKRNLHTIIENSENKKIENQFFDQLWYENRLNKRKKGRLEQKMSEEDQFYHAFKDA